MPYSYIDMCCRSELEVLWRLDIPCELIFDVHVFRDHRA